MTQIYYEPNFFFIEIFLNRVKVKNLDKIVKSDRMNEGKITRIHLPFSKKMSFHQD